MKKFNVLPTDPSFTALSNEQIMWILYSMERDEEEKARQKKGRTLVGEYQDYDTSWYDIPHDEWTPLVEGHDEADIARQLEEATTAEDMARLKARLEESQEVDSIIANGGTTIEEDTINDLIQNNIQRALEEAKRIERHGESKWKEKSEIELAEEAKNMEFKTKLESSDIQDAINLFEGKTKPNSQDDDFEI